MTHVTPEPPPTDPSLRVLETARRFRTVKLIEPSAAGFALLAAEIDPGTRLFGPRRRAKQVIGACKRLCARLRAEPGVLECVAFRAIVRPPGSGGPYLARRREPVRVARYDLVVLLETDSPARAAEVRASAPYQELERLVRGAARHVYATLATNVKRIGPVDHTRDGVFLFNFFVADRPQQNLAVWHYTAGWFQQETGLDNSTVLLPSDPDDSAYTLINHCRWDRLRDVLPSLVLKPSFRSYVLAHFDANDTAPMAVLYKLA